MPAEEISCDAAGMGGAGGFRPGMPGGFGGMGSLAPGGSGSGGLAPGVDGANGFAAADEPIPAGGIAPVTSCEEPFRATRGSCGSWESGTLIRMVVRDSAVSGRLIFIVVRDSGASGAAGADPALPSTRMVSRRGLAGFCAVGRLILIVSFFDSPTRTVSFFMGAPGCGSVMRIVSFFVSPPEVAAGFGGKVMRTVAFLESEGSGD